MFSPLRTVSIVNYKMQPVKYLATNQIFVQLFSFLFCSEQHVVVTLPNIHLHHLSVKRSFIIQRNRESCEMGLVLHNVQ